MHVFLLAASVRGICQSAEFEAEVEAAFEAATAVNQPKSEQMSQHCFIVIEEPKARRKARIREFQWPHGLLGLPPGSGIPGEPSQFHKLSFPRAISIPQAIHAILVEVF